MQISQIIAEKQGLIFDLDGTLVDSMPLHFSAWVQTAKEFNFSYSEEQFYQYAGMPSVVIANELNRLYHYNLDSQKLSQFKGDTFLKLLKTMPLIEPVYQIAKNNFGRKPMAIGTGGKKEIVLQQIALTPLKDIFKHLVCANDVAKHKPEPDTFLLCAEKMNVPTKDCLVFEDGDLGIEAAHRAGIDAIKVVKLPDGSFTLIPFFLRKRN